MGERRERLRLGQDVGAPDGVPGALFLARALDGAFPHVRTEGWQTSATSLPERSGTLVEVAFVG